MCVGVLAVYMCYDDSKGELERDKRILNGKPNKDLDVDDPLTEEQWLLERADEEKLAALPAPRRSQQQTCRWQRRKMTTLTRW